MNEKKKFDVIKIKMITDCKKKKNEKNIIFL